MKKIVIIAGLMFLILNIIAGLLISSYNYFNNGLVAFSIITTTAIIYILFNITKVGLTRNFLTFILILTGLFKIALSSYSATTFRNNYSILFIFGLIIIEVIILLANYYSKDNKVA